MGGGPEGRAGLATDGVGGGSDLWVVTTAGQAVVLHDSQRRRLCPSVLLLQVAVKPSVAGITSFPALVLPALSTPVSGLLSSPPAGVGAGAGSRSRASGDRADRPVRQRAVSVDTASTSPINPRRVMPFGLPLRRLPGRLPVAL